MDPRLTLGWRTGLVVASATAGVLVAFGVGQGRPLQTLNLLAQPLLGTRAVADAGAHPLVTSVGVLAHIAGSVIWSTLFVLLAAAARLRGWWRQGALAAGMAALLFALNHRVLPLGWRPGFDAILSGGQLLTLHIVLAAALVLGMRLALLRRS